MTNDRLSIRVLDHPSGLLVSVQGVLDFSGRSMVEAVLVALLDDGRAVAVDLAELDLLDASSLGMLLSVHRRAHDLPVDLRMHGATGRVLRVMEIAGLDKLVDPDGPPAWTREHAEDRTVEHLLCARYRSTDDRLRADLRQQAIQYASGLAVRLSRRYHGRGEPADDLRQVALLGLIKAIDRYDPSRPNPFSGFAIPTVLGELRRHFRDKGWHMRVPRLLQEIRLEMGPAQDVLAQRLGRSPTVSEIGAHLGVTGEQVLEAMEAAQAYRATSLSTPVTTEGGELSELLGGPDQGFELVEYRESLRRLLPTLPVREQRILALRFSGDLTQSQIAEEIGISQMHVSRLLSAALAKLRTDLLCD